MARSPFLPPLGRRRRDTLYCRQVSAPGRKDVFSSSAMLLNFISSVKSPSLSGAPGAPKLSPMLTAFPWF